MQCGAARKLALSGANLTGARIVGILVRKLACAIGLLTTLLLVGCGGMFRGGADLNNVTPMVQPIKPGWYVQQNTENTRIKFERSDDGSYSLLNPIDSQEFVARIFGPVSGLYVAQITPDPAQQGVYGYVIIKIDAKGISLADDASAFMGELLFSRLGVSTPSSSTQTSSNLTQVTELTGNAWLNWALLQELIVKYREQLIFELLYAADE